MDKVASQLQLVLPTHNFFNHSSNQEASEMVQRTCCVFCIISPVVKQLQTSGKKQWSTLDFAQFRCSFEANGWGEGGVMGGYS